MSSTRFALIHQGNEEAYGLLFAGTELKKHGDIKFFDAEFANHVCDDVLSYNPDYLCFSPMSCFYRNAKDIEAKIKEKLPNVISIYGGHHASNSGKDCGDITVVGAVHGLDINSRGVVYGGATRPENLISPSREEYYRDIPRMRMRYRKVMLSVVGCPWSCSYCSSALENVKRMYGETKSVLRHRDIDDIIAEAKFIKPWTHEIEWVDDDVLMGDYEYYYTLFNRWKEEIGLPMYVSATSASVLRAPDALLDLIRMSSNCVGLGVQAIRKESLRLLGRGWDSEEQIKKAYDRLTEHGFRVNLQAIIGLPISDPVEDALDTVDGLVRIGKGSVASVYPLQIYPNTRMERYCLEKKFFVNDCCEGDTNSGLPAIDFGMKINNRLRNICKLATMVVKYGIERRWLEAMLDLDLDDASKPLSMVRYWECINDRLPQKGSAIYDTVISGMHLRH